MGVGTLTPTTARPSNHNAPPLIILGGCHNTLAIVRSLGKKGVDVYPSVAADGPANYSRFIKKAFPVPEGTKPTAYWRDLLFSAGDVPLKGSILFACDDIAVQFIAQHRAELLDDYILDDGDPSLQLAMLDKKQTLELAQSVNVPTPRYWPVEDRLDLDIIAASVRFPAIIKPRHSHIFREAFGGRKLFFANNQDELRRRAIEVLDKRIGIIISEFIAGPDTLNSSHYTYLRHDGQPLFHLTKSVIRRYPVNAGQGCYHITTHEPDTIEMGLRFLQGIGYKGLAHIDFKRDRPGGTLHIIECNPRFTAPHSLLVSAGLDTSWLVYQHLAGRRVATTSKYKSGKRLLFPVKDYKAYRQLKEKGELTFARWLLSLARPTLIGGIDPSDPMPSLKNLPLWIKNTWPSRSSRTRRRPTATAK